MAESLDARILICAHQVVIGCLYGLELLLRFLQIVGVLVWMPFLGQITERLPCLCL